MAGSSMTFTYDQGVDGLGQRGRYQKVTVDWTSDASDGTCTGTSKKIVGRLVKAITDPSATAPTDNYDIQITDEQSNDVLGGVQSTLGNRDTANTEEVYFLVKDAAGTPLAQSIHPVVCDKLTVAITNAGNSKVGQLVLYVEV